MRKILFVALLAILAVNFALPRAGEAVQPRRVAERPNIVVILVDDLGWMDLSVQGSELYETPHIDRLAKMGVRFTNGYASSTVCSPSRSAYMTGKSPARTGITDWIRASFQRGNVQLTEAQRPPEYQARSNRPLICPNNPFWLDLEEVTLAEELKRVGYVTGHIGKWHLGDESWYPKTQGYDENIGGCDFGQPPSYFDPYENKNVKGIPSLPPRKQGEYLTDREGDEVAAFIKRHANESFFLSYCPYAVHTPIQAKEELTQRYLEKGALNKQRAAYAAMLQSLDDAVGKLLATLEETNTLDNTIIIFTGDNGGLVGPTDNSPLRDGKGGPYEGGIRVPWIIAWPGKVKGDRVSDVPIITHDIMPTLLEAVGVQRTRGQVMDGVSLLPLLRHGDDALADRGLYWHFPHYRIQWTPWAAIREGDYKLIHWFEDGRVELYHLGDDLSETKNIADDHPDVVAMLKWKLNALLAGANAKLPRHNVADN